MLKLTTEEFIKQAILIHGDKYDYSNSQYNGAKRPITIFCNHCKTNFNLQPTNHTSKSQGCPNCYNKNRVIDLQSFLTKAKKIHNNKFDYSKVNYINNITRITIICENQHIFEQTPHMHLQGKGCSKCNGGIKDTLNDFLNKVKKIHGDKYDYSLVNYFNSYTKIPIICDKHNIFKQTPNDHLQGKGCPICRESKGESIIRKYLQDNNINYIPQYKFPDCVFKKPLPFDFYLPDHNICIEFNGRQHYKPVKQFGGDEEFQKTKLRDKIKIDYCGNNNIRLIIFKYDEPINLILNNQS